MAPCMSHPRAELLYDLLFAMFSMPTCLIECYRCWMRVGNTYYLLFPRLQFDPALLYDSLPVCAGRVGMLLISSDCCVLFVDRSAP